MGQQCLAPGGRARLGSCGCSVGHAAFSSAWSLVAAQWLAGRECGSAFGGHRLSSAVTRRHRYWAVLWAAGWSAAARLALVLGSCAGHCWCATQSMRLAQSHRPCGPSTVPGPCRAARPGDTGPLERPPEIPPRGQRAGPSGGRCTPPAAATVLAAWPLAQVSPGAGAQGSLAPASCQHWRGGTQASAWGCLPHTV